MAATAESRELAARCWCDPRTSGKVMDTDLAEVFAEMLDRVQEDAANLRRRVESGGCTLAGPDRGDCEHTIGLPGIYIPGQHDGPDDTVDAYGKPNGWCWSCWKSYRLAEAMKLIPPQEASQGETVSAE